MDTDTNRGAGPTGEDRLIVRDLVYRRTSLREDDYRFPQAEAAEWEALKAERAGEAERKRLRAEARRKAQISSGAGLARAGGRAAGRRAGGPPRLSRRRGAPAQGTAPGRSGPSRRRGRRRS